MAIFALISDFGTKDPFVGIMKGQILKKNLDSTFVDLTHNIPRHNRALASLFLKISYPYFPEGAIFLVVVDPGVGGKRRGIVVQKDGYFFVGPDNGVFSLLYEGEFKIWELPEIKGASHTFHGRDLFAPMAGDISLGKRPWGAPVKDPVRLKWVYPLFIRDKKILKGEIVWVDHFGNGITNIPSDWLRARQAVILLGNKRFKSLIVKTYEEGKKGKPIILKGSFGTVEIAIREQNASRKMGFIEGTKIELLLLERDKKRQNKEYRI